MRRLLLVGDHTDQGNLGGRAQSLALSSLLSREFEISGYIPGRVVNGDARYVRTILPSGVVRSLIYRRQGSRWADRIVRLEEALGAADFVVQSPKISADNVLKYASRYPDIGDLVRKVEETDVVVLNGEGSGVFANPFRRDFFFYLAMAEVGLRLDKAVFLTNTIFSDCPITGRNKESLLAAAETLRRCTGVHVRDSFSVEYAKETMPGVQAEYLPDALFSWFDRIQNPGFAPPRIGDFAVPFPEDRRWLDRLDFSEPYVGISGSSLAAYDQPRAVPRFVQLVSQLQSDGIRVVLVQTCGGDRFLSQVAEETDTPFVPVQCPVYLLSSIIARARVFISGRYHPSIVAGLGGVPSIFLEAHSHKIHSLRGELGYQDDPVYSTFPSDDEIGEICERTRSWWNGGDGYQEVHARALRFSRMRALEASDTPRKIADASGLDADATRHG